MDSFLLYRDSSIGGKKSYPFPRDIIKDFNLDVLFKTMARGDELLLTAAKKVMMIPLQTPEEIGYRQEIIEDFYAHSGLLSDLLEVAMEQHRKLHIFKEEMDKNRTKSVKKTSEIIEKLTYLKQGQEAFARLREILEYYQERMQSEGLVAFYHRLCDAPVDEILQKLNDMDFFVNGGEVGYTLQFGGGLKIREATVNYCINQETRKTQSKQGKWQQFYLKYVKRNTMIYRNNEMLENDIEQLKESTMLQMLALFHNYLEDMMHFYEQFALEMAFYKGVLQFWKRMEEMSIRLCKANPQPVGSRETSFHKLYELTMAIYVQKMPVGNSLTLPDMVQTLITGANQGGKSTFLRSYGIALLLMQCGMPVPAYKFSAPIYKQIFTHFSRREDEHLSSGRLREELKRMSEMVSVAESGSIFLLNESFASTTEKEGAKIAKGILQAFYEKGISVVMVTHLFQLSKELYQQKLPGVEFLIAERKAEGERTYRMLPGEPEYTSYGTDLFKVLEEV